MRRWRGVAAGVAASAAATAGLWLLARDPGRAEAWCADGPGHWLARGAAALTSPAPFAVGEWIAIGGALTLALLAARAAWQVARGRRRLGAALGGAVALLVTLAALLTPWFYASWGVAYARPSLPERLGWPEPPADTEARRAHLARLAASLVARANVCYEEAFGSADLGRPSAPRTDLRALDAALEQGMTYAALALGLPPSYATRRGPAKPVALSRALTLFGISGIYLPFTGEATFNREAPWCERPHTIAHEKAHQRGVASEDEANLLGALACALADDPYARYAGALFASRQALGALFRADPDAGRALSAKRLPGVRRDLDAARVHWTQFDGPARSVGSAVNDAYLKAHGVRGGVLAYGRSLELLVRLSLTDEAALFGLTAEPKSPAAPSDERAAGSEGPARHDGAEEPEEATDDGVE